VTGAPPADLTPRVQVAREVAAAAGRLALDFYQRLASLQVRHKAGLQDVVSDADVAVERLIRSRLSDAFPDDAFLGEETGGSDVPDGAGVWVVDPIDGTQPFLSGLPTWCVSIAYLRGDRVLYGLVANPVTDEVFEGGVGVPATRNGRPIRLHPGAHLTDGLTYVGCSPRVGADQIVPVLDRLLRRGGMYLRHGSGALGLCDVACGRLVGFVEAHIFPWDCLGGIAVLQAAGAQVSDYLAGDGLQRGNALGAAPPAIYPEIAARLG
jgi:myo-inositol-1(or 4)-monophosphatase